MNDQLLYSFRRRPRRFTYNSILKDYRRCRGDKEFFKPEDAFQSFGHRLHRADYDRDEDDEDDTDEESLAEGDKSAEEYIDNFIKLNRAHLGLPMPKAWENPFNKHSSP